MRKKLENFLSSYIIPIGATVLAVLFWQQYKCQNAWWWLVAIFLILGFYYYLHFRKIRRIESVRQEIN